MGFFSRKKAEVEENNESVLKEELEIESKQNEFRKKPVSYTQLTLPKNNTEYNTVDAEA